MIRSTKRQTTIEDLTDSAAIVRLRETASNVGDWAGEHRKPLLGGIAAAAVGVTGYLMFRYFSENKR